jgi:hypothetical protein
MVIGSHVILYSKNADADRAFLRDVLEFSSVDAGHGWLIFKLPPAEIALHPAEDKSDVHKMLPAGFYLICDDLQATIKSLEAKKVKCTAVTKERWGILTTIHLPSGGELGLYQPLHPTALHLS